MMPITRAGALCPGGLRTLDLTAPADLLLLEEFRLSGLVVVVLARFPAGDNPAFAQRLEPFLPAE